MLRLSAGDVRVSPGHAGLSKHSEPAHLNRRSCGVFLALAAVSSPFLIAPLTVGGAPTPTRGTLTISADPSPIVYGKGTTIAGKLKGSLKASIPVTLSANEAPYTGGYETADTTTTDTHGNYSFPDVRPLLNTSYQTSTTIPQATSAPVIVRVAIKVKLHLSDRTPRRGQRVRFYGTAAPQHDGRNVYIQKLTSTGWRGITHAVLKDAGTELSKFSKRIRIRRNGTYRARVYHRLDHADGTSPRRSAIVH
jgi:hypothetical protein